MIIDVYLFSFSELRKDPLIVIIVVEKFISILRV